ncbi:NOL1/NOP2/sun family putative RNA methylase [Shewanella denitrificans OS217]|jgi:16S rRNA (cytosine1407-C5)-methyltransferase|uniref:Ribosomal RNA small subunit methyltransferase F n=1 Tax=Shewanella denitrificans (strain OS217 / ATCC BAA-1090 / DSM 15013) TaxID=318161 RepID=RSMF_SHEDO|nr:16S rRNA (cytosine(1407)-C(5))-methyltransferase RsmF [Shewanella denitrificans]Q12MJ8.1 RecName: Full=Ribosomal RNA small subunit methyltransferase F; AltName: Full=16S rRNA m5C1407 methyltransferase; AltName: Full=rRNA (cytosine-C(5)-)-methyltransferase RsmF [Shewanella denitrificans OS217]ABE55328.1 NOL1/NOP2/sun family putative RNA methylase [Shewanella denitrificans OS217]
MLQINPNFIKHIEQELPSHLSMDEFILACNRPLRQSIRVNTLRISSEDFIALMTPRGWSFSPVPWCSDGFWITLTHDEQLGNCLEHIQGLFYIQEASSMLPPTALFTNDDADERAPLRVLDMASAPGSKTTQMAALMNNNGLLIANEYSASRVKVLHANVLRMGVSNCALTHFDGRVFGEYQYEAFDAVLLDAPCGGEGTVRKDQNALKEWQLDDVIAIADTQKDLIEAAFLALKPGGALVYSTCTLSQLENQAICQHLLSRYPEAVAFESLATLFDGAAKACTEEGFLHVWPQIYDSEGFFVAKMRKTASVPRIKSQPKAQKNFPFSPAPEKQIAALQDYIQQSFALSLPPGAQVYLRDDEFWLFPAPFSDFIGTMRFQRIGIKLADVLKKGFKIKHEAVIALGAKLGTNANNNSNTNPNNNANTNPNNNSNTNPRCIPLNQAQAEQFLMGRDIDTASFDGKLDLTPKGEMMVSYHGAAIGVVKHLGHRLKNSLPRELVRDNLG